MRHFRRSILQNKMDRNVKEMKCMRGITVDKFSLDFTIFLVVVEDKSGYNVKKPI